MSALVGRSQICVLMMPLIKKTLPFQVILELWARKVKEFTFQFLQIKINTFEHKLRPAAENVFFLQVTVVFLEFQVKTKTKLLKYNIWILTQ